ncbi:sensor histidine kinase [Gemmatirosa kalamazoonensis]|nr:GAF domain-containing sensor histidine kinase [Gemmatirosa kalamazoonensis]
MLGPSNDTPREVERAPAPPSGASVRLRALAALSGSLTDALHPKEAVDLVEQQALSALGATSAVVVTLGTFPPPLRSVLGAPVMSVGTTLHVVHAIGLPAEVRAALHELPLDAPVPFAEVARTGAPLFLPTEAALRTYPDWGAAMTAAGAGSAAVVPVWANGELRGVLGLAWPEPRTFDEDERAFVLTLGVMCAQAIMRAHLRDTERHAREAAELANRSKAHFVATISHELRTPMNAILGYTALIGDGIYGAVSALQQEHLGRVRASGQHLLGLIEELLGYARIEAGEAVVRPESVGLIAVLEQSLVLVRPLAELKGLRLRVEGPAEPVELYTDPHKLRQILVNLLANAVKFTDQGEVVVLLRVEGRDAAVRLVIEVTDTGCGIPPEVQAHVFDPFWQADPASTHSDGSSGLGLSVARQLARLLGGDVVVARSAPGEGSTFVVSLPAQYPGQPERRAAP